MPVPAQSNWWPCERLLDVLKLSPISQRGNCEQNHWRIRRGLQSPSAARQRPIEGLAPVSELRFWRVYLHGAVSLRNVCSEDEMTFALPEIEKANCKSFTACARVATRDKSLSK